MTPFIVHTGIAAPFTTAHVDTDKIIPARFLKTIERTGLGRHLFAALRYDESGAERPEFVLNELPFRHASILIAGENFGCGSSREHAPWALLDFGVRVIIAPSFADIFYNNCFQNGILPIVLPAEICALLAGDARLGGNARLTIDLPRQVVVRPDGEEIGFEIDPARKAALLDGLDEIGRTLRAEPAIAAHEAHDRAARPWLSAVAV